MRTMHIGVPMLLEFPIKVHAPLFIVLAFIWVEVLCTREFLWALPTPHIDLTFGLDKELSHMVSNCKLCTLSFRVSNLESRYKILKDVKAKIVISLSGHMKSYHVCPLLTVEPILVLHYERIQWLNLIVTCALFCMYVLEYKFCYIFLGYRHLINKSDYVRLTYLTCMAIGSTSIRTHYSNFHEWGRKHMRMLKVEFVCLPPSLYFKYHTPTGQHHYAIRFIEFTPCHNKDQRDTIHTILDKYQIMVDTSVNTIIFFYTIFGYL